MANPDPRSSQVPHLAEVFAVAQTVAGSLAEAETLTIRAFQRTSSLDRFEVLRALLLEAHLDAELEILGSTAAGAESGAGARAADEPQQSVIQARIASRERERVVLDAFTSLEKAERFLAFVASRGIRSAADVARILDVASDEAGRALSTASARLSEEIEKRLDGGPWGRAEDLDRLSVALEGLTEAPGAELRRVVRDESPKPASTSPVRRPSRLIPITFVLLLAAATGLIVPRLFPEPPANETATAVHLLDAVVSALPDSNTLLDTDDPEEADTWFRRRLDWHFEVPNVSGAPLSGTGFVEISPGVQAPSLYYGGPNDEAVSVAVVNYALLQEASDRLMLDRGSLDRLAETPGASVEQRNSLDVLLTRHRDDIYVVLGESAPNLAGRVSFSN